MEPDEDEEESWREFPPNEKKVQLSLSSRAIHGGAYFSDVSG